MDQLTAAVVAFRLLNAALVTTQFDPDEWWQAPEVAHRLVFGYGVLTWEWQHALRGYTHILPFAAAMQLLKWLRLDSATAIAQPRRSPLLWLRQRGRLHVAGLLDVVVCGLLRRQDLLVDGGGDDAARHTLPAPTARCPRAGLAA